MQPAAVGVTVMVPVIGAEVALVAVNGAIFPLPEAAKPMAGLLLVQLYVAPPTEPLKFIGFAGHTGTDGLVGHGIYRRNGVYLQHWWWPWWRYSRSQWRTMEYGLRYGPRWPPLWKGLLR